MGYSEGVPDLATAARRHAGAGHYPRQCRLLFPGAAGLVESVKGLSWCLTRWEGPWH